MRTNEGGNCSGGMAFSSVTIDEALSLHDRIGLGSDVGLEVAPDARHRVIRYLQNRLVTAAPPSRAAAVNQDSRDQMSVGFHLSW
jgi:hypothetical protein